MRDWNRLVAELDAWEASGRTATFWWRDDDACRVTPALERLLSIAEDTETPVALAVIPRDADDALLVRLARCELASVLQHGWGHDNHAPPEERQTEYGRHRPLEHILEELAAGARRVLTFARGLPVLVAPWNRIDEELIPHLPRAGIMGLSVLGPRARRAPVPGVICANVHVDIIDWHGAGGFVGVAAALEQVETHLRQKRLRGADDAEPTGLMTHHLFHDEGCWWFILELIRRTRPHSAARWLAAGEVFSP